MRTRDEVAYEKGRERMREAAIEEIDDLKDKTKRLEDAGVPPSWVSFRELLDALAQSIEPR